MLLASSDVASQQLPSQPEQPKKQRRFLQEHGPRLLISFGISQAGRLYQRQVGPSTSPLLFQDPPFFDRRIRDRLSREESGHYVERYGLETLGYGVPVALIVMDLGEAGLMGRDLLGYLETRFATAGSTLLVKNLVGRERPELEYADPDDLDPNEIDEIRTDRGNHKSFPSGHASGSFAYASYLERAVARKTGLRGWRRSLSFGGLYGLAGYIGYTRIRNDRHYLSDIVAGAALGTWIGRTYYRLNHPEEFGRTGGGGDPRAAIRMIFYPPAPVPGGVVLMLGLSHGDSSRDATR